MKAGLTPAKPCNYLPTQQERLLAIIPEATQPFNANVYEALLARGFRRSHNDIYRPHCDSCRACESLRVLAKDYSFSRNQKRVLAKNRDLTLQISSQADTEMTDLFCRFIELRHRDGAMYPPDPEQFWQWVSCDWLTPLLLCWYDSADKLVAVAATDRLAQSLSAMYTFYDPEAEARSLGAFAILQQLQLAQRWQLEHLYLGYQIDACQKMNYKARFTPHERFDGERWQLYVKTAKITPA
ncbi:arginyltransferase [Idiomarina xiamenensis]|uniref:Aspartate/glutamate leucyltransferase n=1 Tax=Idiomarina xiamenensis 10-D-4 TaxID=740709 RepID=K2KA31_9GAMM|nr:arginyltransferase [Idiomarina xiamenensis]EKE79839.1 arginyl-tRNA-protein transferase [Idiomarina xiamenensis 10-D-4]